MKTFMVCLFIVCLLAYGAHAGLRMADKARNHRPLEPYEKRWRRQYILYFAAPMTIAVTGMLLIYVVEFINR